MSETQDDGVKLACDVGAIAPEERPAHQALAEQLFTRTVLQRQELPDGYAFLFPTDHYDDVVAFVANERRCCPFFAFSIEVSPNRGPITLRMTGSEGVKQFLQAELGDGTAMD